MMTYPFWCYDFNWHIRACVLTIVHRYVNILRSRHRHCSIRKYDIRFIHHIHAQLLLVTKNGHTRLPHTLQFGQCNIFKKIKTQFSRILLLTRLITCLGYMIFDEKDNRTTRNRFNCKEISTRVKQIEHEG